MSWILNLFFATAIAAVFASSMSECLWATDVDDD